MGEGRGEDDEMRVTARLTLSVAKVGGWAAALMASETAVRAEGGGVAVRAAMLFAVLLAQCSRRLGLQPGGEGGGRKGCGRVESTMAVRVEGTSATEQERTNCGPSRPVGWLEPKKYGPAGRERAEGDWTVAEILPPTSTAGASNLAT